MKAEEIRADYSIITSARHDAVRPEAAIVFTMARLGDVTESMKNGLYKPASEYSDDGVPCLRMYNIDGGQIAWRDIKRMRVGARELEDYGLLEGDLLVNRVNSRELVGKTALIAPGMEPSVFESKNIRLRLKTDRVLPKFINYQLLAFGRRHFSNNAQQVVGMASVSQKQLADFPIVVAHLGQQKRIVAEIEKQFSRLDEAVANLKRVKANLKRYKAAVLKAAVEGRLVETEAELARKRTPSPLAGEGGGEGASYETGAQLLQRILETRRSQWKGKGKYKEPAAPDTTDLPELPEGWVWATVGQIACLVEYGSSAKTNEDPTEVPVLRMGNIFEGELSFDDLKYLPNEHEEFPKLLLETGDLLFNRTNSPELVGKTAVFRGYQKRCSFASYLIRVRLSGGCDPDFVAAFINSTHGRNWVKAVVTQQVGQANVNGTKLQALNIPLPPEAEQNRIVPELRRRLSLVQEIEYQAEANLVRASRLRMAILSKNFEGTAHAGLQGRG